MSERVLKSYRALIRASRLAFQGDNVALNASRDRIRNEFTQPGPFDRAEVLKKVQMAKDVAHILRSNVVQGKLNEKGNYKLGIHKETELGDNDDRFNYVVADSSGPTQGCCGGSSSK